MIQLPRRSVTRFFIPLIDVLTLLFCIFLLMPVIESAESDPERLAREERLRELEAELEQTRRAGRELPEKLQEELERLRQEKIKTLKDRLAVRVLEIDGGTGRLYYHDPERVEVRNQADARALIDRDRRERGVAQKELYYLILYPRVSSAFPTLGQREQYERWFEGVALGFDVPGTAPGGG
jgi:hypothetical protein